MGGQVCQQSIQSEATLVQSLLRVTSGVYTPGFIVDGKEWRGYFNWLDRNLPSLQQQSNPKLTVNHKGDTFSVSYEGKGDYVAHIALLAMNSH